MANGFMCLVAIMNWHSRRGLSWRIPNTLDADFCLQALEETLWCFGAPELVNADQGAQFTFDAFTRFLQDRGIAISDALYFEQEDRYLAT